VGIIGISFEDLNSTLGQMARSEAKNTSPALTFVKAFSCSDL
jgi:hypothetical protein